MIPLVVNSTSSALEYLWPTTPSNEQVHRELCKKVDVELRRIGRQEDEITQQKIPAVEAQLKAFTRTGNETEESIKARELIYLRSERSKYLRIRLLLLASKQKIQTTQSTASLSEISRSLGTALDVSNKMLNNEETGAILDDLEEKLKIKDELDKRLEKTMSAGIEPTQSTVADVLKEYRDAVALETQGRFASAPTLLQSIDAASVSQQRRAISTTEPTSKPPVQFSFPGTPGNQATNYTASDSDQTLSCLSTAATATTATTTTDDTTNNDPDIENFAARLARLKPP
jgi:hypothetical protein